MSLGKVNVARRVWFGVKTGGGAARPGLTGGDMTITVRDPTNSNTSNPAPTEVGALALYFFDIPAAFSLANGAGTYGWQVQITTAPLDMGVGEVDFFVRDVDDVAQPGDEMDLATDALDADAVATSGANEIRDSILSDSTPFAGANIAELDASNLPADIDTLLARLTAPRAANLDEITALRLAELDPANLPADIDLLLARLTAARALLLDNLAEVTAIRMAELDAANLPADIDTLLVRLTALRAANLDEITAVRLAELDAGNLPADVAAVFAAVALVLSTGGAGPWTSATSSEADRVEIDVVGLNTPTTTLRVAASLYRNGVQITAVDPPTPGGITGGTILFRTVDGGTILVPVTPLVVHPSGELSLVTPVVTLVDATQYVAEVSITDGLGTVSGRTHNPTV